MQGSTLFRISMNVFLVFSSIIVSSSVIYAQNFFAPNQQGTLEGNVDNGAPFSINEFGWANIRYQQVYSAITFSALTTPSMITKIAFRPDATLGHAFGPTNMLVDIRLSTTSAAVDGLANIFTSNTGVDETVVYSGTLTLSSSFTGPVGGPKDFDIVIPLQNPFLYNPSAGNLLLDVRQFSSASTSRFDAQFTTGDGVSRVFTTGADVSSTRGPTDTLGLVTLFSFQSTAPEPKSLVLFILGAMGSCLATRRIKT